MTDFFLAHGFDQDAPAGGGAIAEVVIGTLVTLTLFALLMLVVTGHRRRSIGWLGRLADFSERQTGLPGWASLPIAVQSGALLIAVFGMYWDIATHIDAGRDPGPFANASHYFILVGLFGAFLAGVLAIFLPMDRPSRAAIKIRDDWYAPLGGVLILLCAAIALSAFPLDDMWHRIFGQDVTLWGPTHLLLFGGAALTVVGALILRVEARQARETGDVDDSGGVWARRQRWLLGTGFAGALLIAMSTFQGEFDYAVPQFRLIMHPVLLMFAAGIALVAVRVHLGKGGALLAVAFFLVVRGLLSLLVSPIFGHTTLHFPLYLVEAIVVELVALRWDARTRPLTFGAIAGVAIGTVGLAAEWAWSYVWWTIEWPSSMLPEAAIAGFVTAVAASILGAGIGRALNTARTEPDLPGKWVLPLAGLAIVAVCLYSVPISKGDPVSATITIDEVAPAPERAVSITARVNPEDAVEDAHWFVATAWQGAEGRSVVDALEATGEPGVYRTTEAIPAHGSWKTTLRLHTGSAVQGLAIYFPEDKAIPVEGIPAPNATFQRDFEVDAELLRREEKPNVSPILKVGGYLIVLVIAILLVGSLVLGLRRLERTGIREPAGTGESPPVGVGTA